MEKLILTEEEIDELLPIDLKNTINTESNIYYMPNNDEKLLKIYDKSDTDYLDKKLKSIQNVIKFNKDEKIEELVVPTGYIYLEDLFIGEILPKINGETSNKYLHTKEIAFNKKIEILKKIGILLKKINNANPKYEACFSDVHFDNFMVSDENIYAVDTSSMKILDSEGIINYYLYQLGEMDIDKYDVDYAGIIKPNYQTDIYCYVMMVLKILSGSDLYIISIENYNKYLDRLLENGFDEKLIESFYSVYEEDKENISPLPHLDTLYDLDEKKLSIARKIF